MGSSIIQVHGTVGTVSPTPWLSINRQQSAKGGRVSASYLNTDMLLALALPAGTAAPTDPLTAGQAGVRVIPPGCWIEGTPLDPASDIYLQAASGNQTYTLEDQDGFASAGLTSGGFTPASSSGAATSILQTAANSLLTAANALLTTIKNAVTGTLSVGGTVAVSGGAINIGQAGSDGSTNIQTGGTAQNLFGNAIPPNGYELYNPDASNWLWFSDTTTALAYGQGSIPLPPLSGYSTPPNYKPPAVVSIVGAVTGQKITGRKF